MEPALLAAVPLSTHASPAGAAPNFRQRTLIKQRDSVPVRQGTLAKPMIVTLVVQLAARYATTNILIYACTAQLVTS